MFLFYPRVETMPMSYKHMTYKRKHHVLSWLFIDYFLSFQNRINLTRFPLTALLKQPMDNVTESDSIVDLLMQEKK